jgi:hypothetical protein
MAFATQHFYPFGYRPAFFNVIYLIQNHLITDLRSYWLFLRVDIVFVLFAGLGLFIVRNIHPIQTKSRKA